MQVDSLIEISSDHCPILVHVAFQYTQGIDVRRVADWNCFGLAVCRRLPEEISFDSIYLIDEAVAVFDDAITSSLDSAL